MLELLNSYDQLIERTRSMVQTLKIYPKVFEKAEHKYLHKFFDKLLYITSNHLDLIIGLKFLHLSGQMKNNVEANFFARIVVVNLHETLDDLDKLVGKEIRNEVIDKLGQIAIVEIDKLTKELNKIKKNEFNKLKEIRNNLIAHKLSFGFEQTKMNLEVNTLEIYKIGRKIFDVQMKLITLYNEVIPKV